MRVLICGSRDWADYEAVATVLAGLDDQADSRPDRHLVVIEGGAKGADACAAAWCEANKDYVGHERFPADWETYGKSAGPVRNREMLEQGKPEIVWAFKTHVESRGTNHMVNLARTAGVPTYVVTAPVSVTSGIPTKEPQ